MILFVAGGKGRRWDDDGRHDPPNPRFVYELYEKMLVDLDQREDRRVDPWEIIGWTRVVVSVALIVAGILVRA